MEITKELVNSILHYNPETGDLKWKPRNEEMFRQKNRAAQWGKRYAGREAGRVTKTKSGYARKIVKLPDGKDYLAHRVIFLIMSGEWPQKTIDHVNRNATDNRWSNLRLIDLCDNSKNLSLSKSNACGFTGVNWRPCRQRWRAQIMINGKHTHLGYFKTMLDAVSCRIRANKDFGFSEGHGRKSA